MMYDMFDGSYLGPEGYRLEMASLYWSPGRAPDDWLKDALLGHIALYTCEWN